MVKDSRFLALFLTIVVQKQTFMAFWNNSIKPWGGKTLYKQENLCDMMLEWVYSLFWSLSLSLFFKSVKDVTKNAEN